MKFIAKKIEKIGFEKFSLSLIGWGVVFLFIGSILFLIGECKSLRFGLIKADKFGQFGDIIGGVVGSMWALAGVLLFYAAFKKQIESLENQKLATEAAIESIKIQSDELKLQRSELQQTREVFKQQEETIRSQRFENSFYNLLNLLNSNIQNIDLKEEKELKDKNYIPYQNNPFVKRGMEEKEVPAQRILDTHKGRDCLEIINKEIGFEIDDDSSLSKKDRVNEIKRVFNEYESDLMPYCNLIRQIIITIKVNKDIDQEYYLRILTSQFTKSEISLLKYFREANVINRIFEFLFVQFENELLPLEEEE